jgi:hypothetical protein
MSKSLVKSKNYLIQPFNQALDLHRVTKREDGRSKQIEIIAYLNYVSVFKDGIL